MGTEIPNDHDDVRRELAEMLNKIRSDAGKTCKEMAALAGHTQSWWSKLALGETRSVDVESLRRLDAALSLSGETSARMFALADAVNKLDTSLGRGVVALTGAQRYNEWEWRAPLTERALVSSADTIPIPLWCREFGEAVSEHETERRRVAVRSAAQHWRSRIATGATVIQWRLGQAAIRRRYGVPTDVLAAQFRYLADLLTSCSPASGFVPFTAEFSGPVPSWCITDNAVLIAVDTTGTARYPLGDTGQFRAALDALPIVSGADAVAMLREELARLSQR